MQFAAAELETEAPPEAAHATPPAPQGRGFVVEWARSEEDVRAAQRLRFEVFAQEMGARLAPPPGTPPGLDVDRFDPFLFFLRFPATVAAMIISPSLVR